MQFGTACLGKSQQAICHFQLPVRRSKSQAEISHVASATAFCFRSAVTGTRGIAFNDLWQDCATIIVPEQWVK